jgi:hypothetical protein
MITARIVCIFEAQDKRGIVSRMSTYREENYRGKVLRERDVPWLELGHASDSPQSLVTGLA